MFKTQNEFKAFINGVKESNPVLGAMMLYVFQELRSTAKDSTIADEIAKNYNNGNIAEIKITAYELGYKG